MKKSDGTEKKDATPADKKDGKGDKTSRKIEVNPVEKKGDPTKKKDVKESEA